MAVEVGIINVNILSYNEEVRKPKLGNGTQKITQKQKLHGSLSFGNATKILGFLILLIMGWKLLKLKKFDDVYEWSLFILSGGIVLMSLVEYVL